VKDPPSRQGTELVPYRPRDGSTKGV